uniref:Uncharacterized protein n=1 Tax=Schistosoma japonicum TaxID=6182 RepID=Q5C6R7_SCHJA|nr:unknown [Schistosoma japonicum]
MQIHNQIFLYAFASLLKLNLPLIFHCRSSKRLQSSQKILCILKMCIEPRARESGGQLK